MDNLEMGPREAESIKHFETEFLGPKVEQSESEIGENRLCQPPEKITEQELTQEESNLSFNFANEQRRVDVGYNQGKPFLQVEFYSDLPTSLSKAEQDKFATSTRIINGNVREVHALQYGDAPEVDESKDFNPHETGEFHVAKPLDYVAGNFERFVSEKKSNLEKIFKQNIGDEGLAQVIIEQVVGYIEAKKQIPPEILASIPEESQKRIQEQIKSAVESEFTPKPEKIDEDKLVELIKDKRIVLYTGAGISMASGVPGMEDLKGGLGIDTSKEIDGFTKTAVENPQNIIENWEKFAHAAENAKPTEAHKAITQIAEGIGCQVLTTNVDTLHEQTGIKPIHTTAQWQKEGLRPEWLKEINAIVVVGLAADAKGFLGWYRENNPEGKIIAVNLEQPAYLGNQDYLLQGDIQKTLPRLAGMISLSIKIKAAF